MRRQLAAGMAAFFVLASPCYPVEQPATEELETFVVSGEQPGPGLWKVSKGDHVMWVLATYAPLPKGMKWRSQQVETRIAESQEVLYMGGSSIAPNIGIWRGLTLIPAALKAGKIPDGKTLKDVLPPETYSDWLAMRLDYIGKDDDVERWRPAIALEQLRAAAYRKSGLQGGPNVHEIVGEIRKQKKVPRNTSPTVNRTVRVEDPRGMLKSAQKIELPDLECFKENLPRVESDIERARETANAWAVGDVAKLRGMHRNLSLKEAIRAEGCAYTLMDAMNAGESADAAHLRKTLADFEWHAEQASLQAKLNWIAAAQKSLEKNASTFAVLSLGDVFRPDGPIEKLRSLGYTVEEPL